ncbi:MAG: ABC transporter permease [Clostridia bacterium]|nr:ABC transporter permease [Clostridia bacterium]
MLRISKRMNMPRWKQWLIRLAAIVLALLLDAVIIYGLTKMNPLKVYSTMFAGVFGTSRRIWNAVRDVMMLLCIGVGLAPAFKMKFWNIGAEGQILLGGIAAAACMIYLKDLPNWLLLIIMCVAALAAGGLWGFIPALSKARLNTNETLFTLMMNYIAIQLTAFFVTYWENSYGSGIVGTINPDTMKGWFPPIFGQMYGMNVLIVFALVVLIFFYLRYTKHGYEIAVVGESHNTAKYAGISVPAVTVRTVTLSGAICGLAGFIAVAGQGHTISVSTAGGRGFIAIIVAWLAKFNTFVMILISFLLVFLEMGAKEIASRFNINDNLSKMIMGVILFFILGSEFFINYRIGGAKDEAKEGSVPVKA